MSLEELNPDTMAREWSTRVVSRMTEAGMPKAEVNETGFIIHQLVKTAAKALKDNPKLGLPEQDVELPLDKQKALLVLDLFIRSISSMAKTIRNLDLPEPMALKERSELLEKMAWETFEMAKLLVASLYLPNSPFKESLNNESDLHILMRQSMKEILRNHLPKGVKVKKADKPKTLDPLSFQHQHMNVGSKRRPRPPFGKHGKRR